MDAFGYKIQQPFEIEFDDGSKAQCIALEPPEKIPSLELPWKLYQMGDYLYEPEYHMAPEIFVSDGEPGSVVGEWVKKRDGIGGIHHLAYQVESVEKTMQEWKNKGYAEFSSEKPMTCPGLIQVFTVPSQLTGVIYEFIERGEHGFCKDNVKNLMLSTKNF